MHQRNVTPCVCLSVCVCVWRGHVYLPSPLFLLLPAWAICSEAQTALCVLLRAVAAIGFGCISSPSFTPPISCFSSVSSLLSNSGFCLGFGGCGRVVERLVLCEQRRRPPNTITGCFGPLHFTRSEGADLSQLRAGRTGCCPSLCDPPPSPLWSLARYAKPEPEHFTLSVQAVDDRACPIITIWFRHFWVIRQKDDKLPLSHSICPHPSCFWSCF